MSATEIRPADAAEAQREPGARLYSSLGHHPASLALGLQLPPFGREGSQPGLPPGFLLRGGHDRLAEARLLFEQMLGYGNHLGLYAVQTGPSGEALGNFPQAFTHLALISAAYNLDRQLP